MRSTTIYAKIKSVDTTAAKSADGVVAVFTGEDVAHINGIPTGWQVNFTDGEVMREPKHPLLVKDKALHVGDGVAIVIAESKEQACDAANLIEVDYEELSVVVDASKALEAGAPMVHDELPDNRAFDWQLGDKVATDTGMAKAHHVTKMKIRNQRMIANAIEPRSYIGDYSKAKDQYTLYTSSQNPHVIRLLMCAFVLGIPEHKTRVVSKDVGGGFGSKIFHYAEEALVTWASQQIARPVKWTAERKAEQKQACQHRADQVAPHRTVAAHHHGDDTDTDTGQDGRSQLERQRGPGGDDKHHRQHQLPHAGP